MLFLFVKRTVLNFRTWVRKVTVSSCSIQSMTDSVRVRLTPKHQLLTSCGLQWHHKAAGHGGNQTHPCPLPCPNPLSPPTFPLLSPINCFPRCFCWERCSEPLPPGTLPPPAPQPLSEGKIAAWRTLALPSPGSGGQVLHTGFLFWCHYSNAATLIFT